VHVNARCVYRASRRRLAGFNRHRRLQRPVPERSRRFITERETTPSYGTL